MQLHITQLIHSSYMDSTFTAQCLFVEIGRNDVHAFRLPCKDNCIINVSPKISGYTTIGIEGSICIHLQNQRGQVRNKAG